MLPPIPATIAAKWMITSGFASCSILTLGKPIVQFDLVEGGRSAGAASMYADAGDIEGLGDSILTLLDDPQRRFSMAQAGLSRFEQELEWPPGIVRSLREPAATDSVKWSISLSSSAAGPHRLAIPPAGPKVFTSAVDSLGGHRPRYAVVLHNLGGLVMEGIPEYPTRKRRRESIGIALLASDTLMLGLAAAGATLVRWGKIFQVTATLDGYTVSYVDLSLVICGIWMASLYLGHLYNLDRVGSGTGEYKSVARMLSFGVIAFILATYLLKLPALSRSWTLLAWSFGIALVVVGRFIVRAILSRLRSRGFMMRPTLIVGANAEAADIVGHLRRNPAAGYAPIGCLTSPHPIEGDRRRPEGLDGCGGVPCLGYADDIGRVLDDHFVDTVLIASTAFNHDVLTDIINKLRGRDLDIRMSSGLLDVISSRVQVRDTSGLPLMTIQPVSFSRRKMLVKRAFDLLFAGIAAVVGLPVWIVLAAGVRLSSPGPVLFRQLRTGRRGREFEMLKFRSMYADAPELHARLAAESNEADGPIFKMKNDPRVTSIGRLMRKFSLDELPQLLNVLKGDMSLVGPRPLPTYETTALAPEQDRRHEVPPGLTGMWQVSGRSKLTFDEMIRLDLYYIENWSVTFDFAILMRTIPVVLLRKGAY